jgi:hypothetical protein
MESTGIPVDEEIYGVDIMRYLSVMGTVLALYDILLTLDEEVCLAFFCPIPCFPPDSLFVDTSRLAGGPFLAKIPVLL